MSAGPMRYCPICGTVNQPDADCCISCRRTLPGHETRPAADPTGAAAAYPTQTPTGGVSWSDPFGGVPGSTTPDGYPDYDFTSYASGANPNPAAAPTAQPTEAYAPIPSSYNAYQYGAADTQTQAFPPEPPATTPTLTSRQPMPPPTRRQSGGRGGCLMGCLAFLIIGIVAVAVVFLGVVRPLLQDEVGDELGRVVATQVAQQLAPGAGTPELTAGTYTISAADINAELRQNADDYDPLEDPRITIDQDGLELSFDAYGTESSYRGGVAVEDGRLVLTDIDASGFAERVLPADDVQEIIEAALNDYIAAADLIITDVELSDGALTLTTAADSSPRATPSGAATPAPRAANPTRTVTPRVIAPPRTTTPPPTLEDAAPPPAPTSRPRPAFPRPAPTPTPDSEAETADDGPTGDGTGL